VDFSFVFQQTQLLSEILPPIMQGLTMQYLTGEAEKPVLSYSPTREYVRSNQLLFLY
jgi:hypothetical protein